MRLLLMRHGQTHANVTGELDTAHPGVVKMSDTLPNKETRCPGSSRSRSHCWSFR